MPASFSPTPFIVSLIEAAERGSTWCAARSTKDAYAFAFRL